MYGGEYWRQTGFLEGRVPYGTQLAASATSKLKEEATTMTRYT